MDPSWQVACKVAKEASARRARAFFNGNKDAPERSPLQILVPFVKDLPDNNLFGMDSNEIE